MTNVNDKHCMQAILPRSNITEYRIPFFMLQPNSSVCLVQHCHYKLVVAPSAKESIRPALPVKRWPINKANYICKSNFILM